MDMIDWQGWLTVCVIISIAGTLLTDLVRPDMTFLGGLGVLLVADVITPIEAFAGFSNPAVLTVGALFVVAAGVQQTEAVGFLDRLLFARKNRLGGALPRMMIGTAGLSAFLNNTPIVAMLTPRVQAWARRQSIPASKVLIPLSYAAIAGGMMTLIGTSTNIVVSGLLQASGYPPLGLFDLTWVGVPAVAVVVAFFGLGGHRLLPDVRRSAEDIDEGLTDYLFEVQVAEQAPFIGQTIEEARLRALERAYLVHIQRHGHLVSVDPDEVLLAHDILTFTGNAAMLEDLLQRPGLQRILASDANPVLTQPLYEAVVADTSSLVGNSLRDVRFREAYGGVVLAIHRRNERLDRPLGRVPIKAGDLLLVEANNGFAHRWSASRDEFYLVALRKRSPSKPIQPQRARLALGLLLAMVGLVTTGMVELVTAVFITALLMVLTRCLSGAQARKAVDLQVLIIIAAALGLGQAVVKTGLAAWLAEGILNATVGMGMVAVLVLLYITTNVLTELITHKAAAVLMLPVALATAVQLGGDPKAFAILIAVSAAASFMTPIGYQTNLMVMAAGGYRVRDYFRVGLPVSLLVMLVSVSVIYWIWM